MTKVSRLLLLGLVVITTAGYVPPGLQISNTKQKAGSNRDTVIQRARQIKSDWKAVGYGGGGAMFYPEVSPFDPNYAFVACDMTGSYVTYNGGKSWGMFNLHGPVHFFVFDPIDSNTVYANSIGLFKSTDRGLTWNLLYPSSSETVGFVGKGDHAEELIITRDSSIRKVHAFAIDPEDSKKLFAVIAVDKTINLFISSDGGGHWSKDKDLAEDAKNIFIDPSSSKSNRTLYVTGNSGISMKKNGKWAMHKNPAPVKMLTHYTSGYDQKNKKLVIYAISGKSYFNPAGDISGIYYSDNGGASWENRQGGITSISGEGESPEWRTIATSLHHPEVVYVSYSNLKVRNDTTFIGVAKSMDFGRTWALSWKDIIHKSGNLPSANFKDGWINERFGPTWGENPFSIGVSPNNADVCYATDFGRTVMTRNGGITWEQAYTNRKAAAGWVSRGLEVTTGYYIVADPFDKNHVFICNTDVGLMESVDGGSSWQSATKNNGVPRKWQNSTYWLAFDPEVKGRAFAAMSDVHDLPRPKMFRKNGVKGYQGGILVTNNGGKTWNALSADIGEGAMTHILVDPSSNKEARTLYACAFGKGVYKSVDGGKSWKQKNNGIEGKEPFAWRITRRAKDAALFLVINRRGEDGTIGKEGDGALYRSDDGAETWQRVSLPSETNAPMSIVADEQNDGRLVLSAWGRKTDGKFSPDIGGGIFLSENDGKTWAPVLEADQHIHDISHDPRNNVYYACGFNGSAYRSDDKGRTWARIRGYDFKWGKRVDPDPADPNKIYIITFGGGLWHGPSTETEQRDESLHIRQMAEAADVTN